MLSQQGEGSMAKLYFRHGAMGSSKTLNLLAVAHNYRQQGKKILLMKPDLENRFGKDRIKSRAGLEAQADILILNEKSLQGVNYTGVSCILVDEAQFLPPKAIDELRRITVDWDIPVICYGLRTDFKSHLFEGTMRLMELADSIEEVKATCHYCNRKSIMNLKHVNGVATNEGAVIDLGADEKYFPTCYNCYRREIDKGLLTKLQGAPQKA
jgi:thymidine kinase